MEKNQQNISVLYIDDDEDEYIILKHYLSKLSGSYSLAWVDNFKNGLEDISTNKFDLCIIDYRIGADSGIELISEIRSRGFDIPIIFLSGQGDLDLDLKAIETGATDFLDKGELNPVTLEQAFHNSFRKKDKNNPAADSSYYDPLTSLPGKSLFMDRLSVALHSAKRYKRTLALLSVNIDDFSGINSKYGHDTGDMLLKMVSKKIQSLTRGEKLRGKIDGQSDIDTIARLDGDTFAILLPEIHAPENAAFIADRIEQAFAEKIVINDLTIEITVSIGIAVHPDDSSTISTLITKAGEALSAAKESGKNCFCYHQSKTDKQAKQRLLFYKELSQAIKEKKLFLAFQPVINPATSAIIMIEAFLRWDHPDKGPLTASGFIDLVADQFLSLQLEQLVYAEIDEFYHKYRNILEPDIKLNMNISEIQLKDPLFPDRFATFLKTKNITPRSIVLDICYSESGKYQNCINKIRKTGALISVDNFGSRKSTFSMVTELPADFIKIDTNIIQKLSQKPYRAAAAGIICFGKHLDIPVIAENVETDQQLRLLKELNCPLIQGNLYYHALLENLIVQIIKSNRKQDQGD